MFCVLLPCLLNTAHATSLMALIDDARESDAKLKSAESAYRADIEKEAQGRAGLLPQVSAQQSDYRNGVRVPGERYPGYPTVGFTVSLSQPIFKWDAWETYQQGKLSVIGAALTLEQAQADLLLRVSQAYFDALAAQDDLTLAGKHRQAIIEQLALTKRRFELGDATAVDISEAQSAFDSANADEIAAQEALDEKYAALQKIVGHPVLAVDGFRASFSMPPVDPPDIDQWVAAAADANYDVRQKQISVEIAERERSKARAGDYPTISLVGNVNNGNAAYINGQSNFNTGGNRGTSTAIGIQITLPLTDGFMTRSRIREALALKEKAEHDLDDAERSAELDARRAYLGVTRGTAKVSALQTAVTSAEVALKSNQTGYRVGVRVNADVLSAQDKLFGARRDLAKARYETLMEGLRLKASAARLEVADLNSVNSLLTGAQDAINEQQKSASGD
ncbi:TolC family outer membrane protein [Paraburkholderia sp. J12]|uniref:TolC family outer membrane protein n=1 Tax=Paraburkholderia sp. J12 TaxID=2805432 RepID=UPI002ABDEA84|nr:TolC family outer membrane protein [Paraburkholderia sp. J12]